MNSYKYEVFVNYNVGPRGKRVRESNRFNVTAENIPDAMRHVKRLLPAGSVIVGKTDIFRR